MARPAKKQAIPTAEELSAQKKKARAEASARRIEARIEELTDIPRLQARSIEELENLIKQVLPELIRLYRRKGWTDLNRQEVLGIRLNLNAPRLGRQNEDRYNKPLSAEPKTSLRLCGSDFVVWKRRPSMGPGSALSDFFPYFHEGCGGGSTEPGGGFSRHFNLTLCLDDFPLILEAYQACLAHDIAVGSRKAAVILRTDELKGLSEEMRAAQAVVSRAEATLEQARVAYMAALQAAGVVGEKLREQAEQDVPALPEAPKSPF